MKGVIDIKTNKFMDNPFVVYRIRAGLRQEDVAALLGINRAAVANWETGRALPMSRLLPALARWRREEGVWRDGIHAVAFGAGVLLAMQLGRAVISLAFGASISGAAGCFTTEIITDLFTLLILWIVRRLDGVLEDQQHYLLRIRQEENGGVR